MTDCQRQLRNERILVIEDDSGVSQCVECILQSAGFRPVLCTTGKTGLERARMEDFDLVVTDLKLPDASGLDIIAAAKTMDAELPVMLMTSFSSTESAVDALRRGAIDYIIKPFRNDDFLFAIERALNERRIRRENALLKRNLRKVFTKKTIVGESERIKRMLSLIQRVAPTDSNVLIQGESGTGKELVAQAIHFSSTRSEGPFVPINCGAIPSELLEAELFGRAKGAYTGATTAAEGLVREASGGTLFLDEISEMPLNLQVKLLRVLQERQVRPLGSAQSYQVDTRFLAASNRDLKAETDRGTFRADLFYRLNVISIHVPALRERGKDIDALAQYFLHQQNRRMGKRIQGFAPDFSNFLHTYEWPGNVRELENLIERAVILAESDMVALSDLVDMLPFSSDLPPASTESGHPLSIEEYIRDFIARHQHAHSEVDLARMLGIGRKALWERRRRWGLFRDESSQGRRHPTRHHVEAP